MAEDMNYSLIENIINKTAGNVVYADDWNIIFRYLVDTEHAMKADIADLQGTVNTINTTIDTIVADKVDTYIADNPITSASDSAKLGGIDASEYLQTVSLEDKLTDLNVQKKVANATAVVAGITSTGLYAVTTIPISALYKMAVTTSNDFSSIANGTIIIKI